MYRTDLRDVIKKSIENHINSNQSWCTYISTEITETIIHPQKIELKIHLEDKRRYKENRTINVYSVFCFNALAYTRGTTTEKVKTLCQEINNDIDKQLSKL